MTIQWNAQQVAAIMAVGEWLKDPDAPQVFRLFGYAGTGKTTLAKYLAEKIDGVTLFAAYTGKAASVMRAAGCWNVSTLHSLLYEVKEKSRQRLTALKTALETMPTDHPEYPETAGEYEAERIRVRTPDWILNTSSELAKAALLVVDEVSMVDRSLGRDIESFRKKILVLGDPAQLPPVKGGGYFTDCEPDILLTEIHRQAADNPIIKWATMAREGTIIPHGNLGRAVKMPRSKITDAWLAKQAGQLLTGKNDTRRKLNATVRKVLGYEGVYPNASETLVCLANNHKLGVLNGVTCHAHNDAVLTRPGVLGLDVRYEGQLIQGQPVTSLPFEFADRTDDVPMPRDMLQFDFGYALTVHKAQGSQWHTVTVYDDGFGKRDPLERRRWLYTAITRAQEQLYIITSS